jgi:ABC-type transport system involved in multi-copper enzyme maturation permease subunit
MNWLFWKEYRQNRVIVIALLVMLIVPHLFGLFLMWAETHGQHAKDMAVVWRPILFGASLYSLGITQVALALIGGNAISGERADRSAEFQAYLPITRKKILAGKLLMALAIAAVIWLTNPPIAWSLLDSLVDVRRGSYDDFALIIFCNMAITGLVFFCVAWLFSSILSSPTFSTIAGLITPLIIWSLILYVNYLIQGDRWEPPTGKILQIAYGSLCLSVALPCFGLGTWLYLRRVEP